MNCWFQFVVICTPGFFLQSSVAFDSLLLEWNQNTVRNMDKLSISELSEVIKQNQKNVSQNFHLGAWIGWAGCTNPVKPSLKSRQDINFEIKPSFSEFCFEDFCSIQNVCLAIIFKKEVKAKEWNLEIYVSSAQLYCCTEVSHVGT